MDTPEAAKKSGEILQFRVFANASVTEFAREFDQLEPPIKGLLFLITGIWKSELQMHSTCERHIACSYPVSGAQRVEAWSEVRSASVHAMAVE
jgi:hypothetical protein